MDTQQDLDDTRRRIEAVYDPELLRNVGHRMVDLLADHLTRAAAADAGLSHVPAHSQVAHIRRQVPRGPGDADGVRVRLASGELAQRPIESHVDRGIGGRALGHHRPLEAQTPMPSRAHIQGQRNCVRGSRPRGGQARSEG